MRLYDRIRGEVRAEIHAVLPEALLNICARQELMIWAVQRLDACTLRFWLAERDLPALERIAAASQTELEILERRGGSAGRRRLRRRWGLFASLALAALLLGWSNLHIWEIEVRGCETLTKGEILRALDDCGVTEGTYWPGLDNETLRGEMLLRLPKLAWMTLRVSGSRAVAVVLERTEKPDIYREDDTAEIVAAQSGVVRRLIVRSGLPLVRSGDAVLRGETLVTGRLESLTGPERDVRASAEVWADTWYELNAAAPAAERKGKIERVRRRFALRFGKKRINLFVGSRKELDGYDTIVHEYNMGVEGLFRLPVSLIEEEHRLYAREAAEPGDPGAAARLKAMLDEQIEGEIVQAVGTCAVEEGFVFTTLRAHCLENIAQTEEATPP